MGCIIPRSDGVLGYNTQWVLSFWRAPPMGQRRSVVLHLRMEGGTRWCTPPMWWEGAYIGAPHIRWCTTKYPKSYGWPFIAHHSTPGGGHLMSRHLGVVHHTTLRLVHPITSAILEVRHPGMVEDVRAVGWWVAAGGGWNEILKTLVYTLPPLS